MTDPQTPLSEDAPVAIPTKDAESSLDYELFMVVFISFSLIIAGALAFLPLAPAARNSLIAINLIISIILLVEFFRLVMSTKDKFTFMIRQGWLIFLGCLPFYPLLRFLLLFRMVVILRKLRKYGGHPIIDKIVERRAENALRYTGFVVILVLTLGSILVLQFESKSPTANILTSQEALWWSIVTVATVGYGDYYPVTLNGRLVGVAIIIVGVGMFGVLASYLAKSFLSPTKREIEDKDLLEKQNLAEAIRRETDELRQEIASMRDEFTEIRTLLASKDKNDP